MIHGQSHQALKHMREPGATIAVYWIYVSRRNSENVAWPSIPGLARDAVWSKDSCTAARRWLAAHGALERLTGYVRPQWRKLPPKERAQKLNLDKAEYYRVTGVLIVDGTTYNLLYIPGNEPSDIEEATDVLLSRMPGEPEADPAGSRPSRPELNTIPEHDSILELKTTTTTSGSGSEAFKTYENEIGILSLTVRNEMIAALEDYPEDWIVEAIKLAALQNKRFWKYVEGILKRWKADGKTGGKASSAPAAYDPGAQYSTETTFVKIPGRSDE